jgi:hypothetical protein
MIVQEFNVAPRALKINTHRNCASLRALEISDLEPFNNDVTVRSFKAEQSGLAGTDTKPGPVNDCSLSGITHKSDVPTGRIARIRDGHNLVVGTTHDLHGITRIRLAGCIIDVPPRRTQCPSIGIASRGRYVIGNARARG